jgi:hypothetical protein
VDQRDGVRITERVVQVTVILWIVWDIIAILIWGAVATESVAIGNWAENMGTIPMAAGVLCGHFFWKVPKDKKLWKYRHLVLVAFALLMMTLDFLMYRIGQSSYSMEAVAIFPFVGYMLGHWFWPQHRST